MKCFLRATTGSAASKSRTLEGSGAVFLVIVTVPDVKVSMLTVLPF
jgi:hypothetical protein